MGAFIWHEHRCACGFAWSCRRPDCAPDDRCDRCEDEARAEYLLVHSSREIARPAEEKRAKELVS